MPINRSIAEVGFGFYYDEEIRRLSVKRIVSPYGLNNLGQAVEGGLHDPSLGPMDMFETCRTCGLGLRFCPGHIGHIELSVPVYHPLLFSRMEKLLRSKCFFCHRFRASNVALAVCEASLWFLEAGRPDLVSVIQNIPQRVDAKERKKNGDQKEIPDRIQRLLGRARELAKGLKRWRTNNSYLMEKRREIINTFFSKIPKTCAHCGTISPKFKKDGPVKMFIFPISAKDRQSNVRSGLERTNTAAGFQEEGKQSQRLFYPNEAWEHLSRFYRLEHRLLDLLLPLSSRKGAMPRKGKKGYRAFFCRTLLVPPNKFRPTQFVGGIASDHAQNKSFQSILELDSKMRKSRQTRAMLVNSEEDDDEEEEESDDAMDAEEEEDEEDDDEDEDEDDDEEKEKQMKEANDQIKNDQRKNFLYTWLELQEKVNTLFDNQLGTRYGETLPPGIRQLLDKKPGLFRCNMMGKRVNYAARSVISPDPYILSKEIGVPERFAKELTFLEPVSRWNAAELRQAIENGPFRHPGANYIIRPDGRRTNLAKLAPGQRRAIARTLMAETLHGSSRNKLGYTAEERAAESAAGSQIVARHLKDGDMVLMNRQPTLHKPSIMAHRVRVLKGQQYQTIRMHYANCKTYNADFDGDEMNLHFPQSYLGQAEARMIANTDSQYVKNTDGSPLRGLIQDHVDAGVLLSCRDCFFEREEYQQLLFQACSVALSDGERLEISTPAILKPRPIWTGKQLMSDLLKFVLRGHEAVAFNMNGKTKLPKGSWGKGETYSIEDTVRFRSGNLLTGTLDKAAFGSSRHGLVDNVHALYGGEAAGILLSLLGRLFTRFIQRHGFTCGLDDMLLTPEADKNRRENISSGTVTGISASSEYAGMKASAIEKFKENGGEEFVLNVRERLRKKLKGETESVALDNVMKGKMSEVTSKIIKDCIPTGQMKPFPKNMLATMTLSGAKGSKVNHTQISCLLGQQELEGRRVPTMCSGRTLPSFLPYDPSPRAGGYITDRFLTGIRPQEYYFHCMAGREGLCDTAVKTSRSGYLQRCLVKHLEALSVQYDYTVRDTEGTIYQFHYGGDCIDTLKTSHLYRFDFLEDNYSALLAKLTPHRALRGLDYKSVPRHLRKLAKKRKRESKEISNGDSTKKPVEHDPILSLFNPGKDLGAVSEKYIEKVEAFAKGVPKERRQKFKSAMYLNYMHCLAPPGESVGVLAAQSVGEPSTQMTLNTFHLAGHGGANVTLGIPRLREIVMTASRSIKTPIMELPVRVSDSNKSGIDRYSPDTRARAEMLAAKLTATPLCSCMSNLVIHESVRGSLSLYRLCISFIGEKSSLALRTQVSETDFKYGLEKKFLPILLQSIKKALKEEDGEEDIKIEAASGDYDQAGPSSMKEDEGTSLPLPGSEGFDEAVRKAREEGYDEPDAEDLALLRSIDAEARVEEDMEEEPVDEKVEEVEEIQEDEKMQPRYHDKTLVTPGAKTIGEIKLGSIEKYAENAYYGRDKQGRLVAELTIKLSLRRNKLLLLSMVESAAESALVRSVPGIDRAVVLEKGGEIDKKLVIQCEGINLMEAWKHGKVVDTDAVSTNDIGMVLDTYGVEACRAAIVEQITAVFGVYGISIDPRHLGLLADYMTHGGGYRPLNRIGIEGSSISAFQKITFETSTSFLTKSCIDGETDNVSNPSSRIVMGLPVKAGTGSFDLLFDARKQKKSTNK